MKIKSCFVRETFAKIPVRYNFQSKNYHEWGFFLVLTANVIIKPSGSCFSDRRSDLLECLNSHKGRNHFLWIPRPAGYWNTAISSCCWAPSLTVSPRITFLCCVAVDIPGPFPWKHIARDSCAWVLGQELSLLEDVLASRISALFENRYFSFQGVLLWNMQLCYDLSHVLSQDGKTEISEG